MGGRGSSFSGGTAIKSNVSRAQNSVINKLKSKLTVGAKGISKYGGSGSTISEAPIFKVNKDGTVNYRVVGREIIPARKYSTIGVGNTPEKIRITVSTGKIMRDGLVKPNSNQHTEEIVAKKKRKR